MDHTGRDYLIGPQHIEDVIAVVGSRRDDA